MDDQLPVTKLGPQNLSNTKTITSREEMLKLLPKNGVVAEIGVAFGDFSELILRNCTPAKLHLIDAWESDRYSSGLGKVEERFDSELKSGIIKIHQGLSTEVLPELPDNHFDWVYIDTDHSYETTAKELSLCAGKIKEEGIIAGHDFTQGNWITTWRYGVREAVYEFCVKENFEILYLTAELKTPSFAIRRIQ